VATLKHRDTEDRFQDPDHQRLFFFHAFSLSRGIRLLLLTCDRNCKATSSGHGWLSAKFQTLEKVGIFEMPAAYFFSQLLFFSSILTVI